MLEKTPQQFYQFDVLRAIAIIGVFFVHCQYAIYPGFDFSYSHFFVDLPKSMESYKLMSLSPFAFGWTGVILFFLISGFLIHYGTLVKGLGNFKLGLFFNRRFWRIYPPYLIALVFFALCRQSIRGIYHNPWDFVCHLLLIHNFAEKYIFSINGVFWSLATEVQLYVLYPVFLYFVIKFNIRYMLLLLVILSLLITLYWGASSSFTSISVGNFTLRFWCIWGLGAYLGECFFYKKRLFANVSSWLLLLLCLVFYFSKLLFIHLAFDHYFAALILAIFIEKYLYNQNDINFLEKLLIPIGLCSYSIYLFHMPFLTNMYAIVDVFHIGNYSKILYFLFNSIPIFIFIYIVSYCSYLFFEKGSIRFGNFLYRRNFFNRKSETSLFKSKASF